MARPSSENPTDWELYLLNVLWDNGESNVDMIREYLRAQGIKRSDSSLRTILRIMVRKGWIKGNVRDRTTYYVPNVQRPSLERKMLNHLTRILFKGKQEDLILRVLDESKVTPEVVEKMEQILREYKDKVK